MPKHPSMTEFGTGTVFSEGEAVITGAECLSWDYNGYRPGEPEVPALHLTIQTAEGDESEEYLTAGSMDDFVPSEDGKCFLLAGSKEKFHIKTKIGAFLDSLLKAGFPKKSLDPEDYGCLVGVAGHLSTTILLKAGGNISKDVTALVFDKVTTLPGKGKGAGGKKQEADSEIDEIATAVLLSVLKTAGKELPRKSLMGKVIVNDSLLALEQAQKTKVINRLKETDDGFLKTQNGWVFEANVLSITSE